MNSTMNINIAEIYQQERAKYLKHDAPRRTPAEWVGLITPWIIVLVFGAFYAQSAQHTSLILNQLAPGVGWLAPIGVEFGLIYLAFRRRQLGKLNWRNQSLRLLLFAVAVLTNFAGALYDVTQQAQLNNLSASDILQKFTSLSAPIQAALLMVAFMAFIVPIVCEVAGHGIADLVFAEREGGFREEAWRRVEVKLTFQAIYNIYVQQGMDAENAQLLAGNQVRGYLEQLDVKRLVASVPNGDERAAEQDKRWSPNNQRTKGERDAVRAFANEHRGEIAALSVTQFQQMLNKAGIAAGRTLAYEIWKEIKS